MLDCERIVRGEKTPPPHPPHTQHKEHRACTALGRFQCIPSTVQIIDDLDSSSDTLGHH